MYKLIAVDQLGSGVWVSASFQILTLEVGEISEVGTAIFQAGEMSEGMSEGGNVLHSYLEAYNYGK